MGTTINKDFGNNRSLRDEFSIPEGYDDANDIAAALYKEELNSRKIDKVSSRITLLAILLPCFIGAALFYGYVDIKERMLAINNSGQSQFDFAAKELETKLNALDLQLAKIKLVFEQDIPELKQQTIAIQDELTLLAGSKSDKEEIDKTLELIKADIAKISDQYQGALHILDRTNQETLSIVNEKSKELEASVDAKIESVNRLQGDIDSKIASIKAVETEIDGKIDSKVDASIDKRFKSAINERLSTHTQAIDKKVADIDLAVESKLATLQEVTEILSESKATIAKLERNIGSVEKRLNTKIDELDLNLSKKILHYATQLESSIKSKNSGSKKKTDNIIKDETKQAESAPQKGREKIILKTPERGNILETDLTN
ncbi:MAG: hypothetical protein HQK64_00640 [Desulfamplus sp.]|nr:hypothetical protein [Desulfamplus sp.]